MGGGLRRLSALGLFALFGAQCFTPTAGLDAWVRVRGASYREGAISEGAGPEVLGAQLSSNLVTPGQSGKPLQGALASSATGVLIGADGDLGHWVLAAALPSVTEPEYPTFSVLLDLSPELPLGTQELQIAAVDEDGLVGPITRLEFAVVPPASEEGALSISLQWDNDADLDLHVVDPAGIEIWKSNINSYQAPLPGELPTSTPEEGGVLDFDAGAGCASDGRRRETIAWQQTPMRGRYRVFVDATSLCGESAAYWSVEALADGEPLAESEGVASLEAEALPHGSGRGALALEFDYP